MFKAIFRAWRRSVVEGNFEEDELDGDHETCLDEKWKRVVCAEPVKDPEMH